MFFTRVIHDQFKPPSLCCQVNRKGDQQTQIFCNFENQSVFPLLSSPTLYLTRSAEVRMCEGCRMENFGGGGGGSKDPWDPSYFTSFPVTQHLVCNKWSL